MSVHPMLLKESPTKVVPVPSMVLMGLPLHGFTLDGLVDYLIYESHQGRGGYVMTPNVDNLRAILRDKSLLDRALAADVRVADGMPLIWASHLQGDPLPARVAGSDLTLKLAAAIAGDRSLYLLGGAPGTADRAAAALEQRWPGLSVLGTLCPPIGYEDDPEAKAVIRAKLLEARPDFVYIGLPFPKASVLAAELRTLLPSTWFLGIGISFSFICGDVARAPRWMQALGLEWVHRLIQEPRRLGRRYLVEGLPFAVRLMVGAAAGRLRVGRVLKEDRP